MKTRRASTVKTPCGGPDAKTVAWLRRRLLAWYTAHHRKLPWRARPGDMAEPYHVLVSETMLQQTQVASVIDYFQRFLGKFPDLMALARADPEQVLHQWQGLGYYRRAKHLHQAARIVMREHGGQLPGDMEVLRRLPGVGRYTAGAIASIAFGKAVAAVDGNVNRVLARLLAIEAAIDHPDIQEHLWQQAQSLVPRKRPGDFNQALMELGATICTPTAPGCLLCPLADRCQARQRGLAGILPRRWKRRAPKVAHHHMLAVACHGKYLVMQRPARGLWADLWQFPTVELETDLDDPWTQVQALRQIKALTGQTPAGATVLARFKHQTTHRTIHLTLWHARLPVAAALGAKNPDPQAPPLDWRRLEDLHLLPQSNPQRRAVALIERNEQTSAGSAEHGADS